MHNDRLTAPRRAETRRYLLGPLLVVLCVLPHFLPVSDAELFTSSSQPWRQLSFCSKIVVEGKKCLEIQFNSASLLSFLWLFYYYLSSGLLSGEGWYSGCVAGGSVVCHQVLSSISCHILTSSICGSYTFPRRPKGRRWIRLKNDLISALSCFTYKTVRNVFKVQELYGSIKPRLNILMLLLLSHRCVLQIVHSDSVQKKEKPIHQALASPWFACVSL